MTGKIAAKNVGKRAFRAPSWGIAKLKPRGPSFELGGNGFREILERFPCQEQEESRSEAVRVQLDGRSCCRTTTVR